MVNKNDSRFLDEYEKLLNVLPSYLKVTQVNDDICCIAPEIKNDSNKKVALIALTHGDEVIGLHLFIKLLEQLISKELILEGELVLVLANRAAYLQSQRYIESDLNRSYGEHASATLEERRSVLIKQAIQPCDYIIDIHQCIEDTLHPFFMLPFSKDSYEWIATVAPDIPIVVRNSSVSATTLSSYGLLLGKKAVTFEVGARGFDSNQLSFGMRIINSFFNFAWREQKNIGNEKIQNPTYEIKYFQSYKEGSVRFVKSFKNFEDIQQGQAIAFLNEKPISTPVTGKILLYPRKWFLEDSPIKADGLFFVLQQIQI